MKISSLGVTIILVVGTIALRGQVGAVGQPGTPVPTAYQVVEQGANYNIWQRETYEQASNGRINTHIHKYTELATGLNYKDANGQWQPSREQIDILPDGTAAATQGQHQVYFPGDIYNGTIELVTPDGLRLKSQPIGLSYDDGTNTILIAVLTNSVGQLVASNQVVYPNAFAGINADLRYTYRKSGFEQDVILHEQPPNPVSLGLNAEKTKLQMLTEFYDSPSPRITMNTSANQGAADENLDFGAMKMVPGRAFLAGEGENAAGNEVRVGKQWITVEGQQILTEQVSVNALVPTLAQLPASTVKASLPSLLQVVSAKGKISLPRLTRGHGIRPMQMVKAGLPDQGLVLDYNTVNGSLTNYIFRADTTYFITGSVYLYGTNTFEGGTVIKYAGGIIYGGAFYQISLGSGAQLNWQAGTYRPVVFTAMDDNSVGQPIAGSLGSPSGYYALCALNLNQTTNSIMDFRVLYAQQAIATDNGENNFYDGQLVGCQNGFECQSGNLNLRNILCVNVQTNFNDLSGATVDIQNATLSGSSNLVSVASSSDLTLENCILANINSLTNGLIPAIFTGTNNGFYAATELGVNPVTNTFYPFQMVGAGGYYLTNGCAFYDVGTTNIDPILSSDLEVKTTYPPTVYSNHFFQASGPPTFAPQVPRDTNASPDLGYHYDPLDDVFGACYADTHMMFTAGTTVGWFGATNSSISPLINESYGMALNFLSGSKCGIVTNNGTATQPCIFAYYATVQEGSSTNWTSPDGSSGIIFNGTSATYEPSIQSVFTKFYALAGDDYHISSYWEDTGMGVAYLSDCEFYGGEIAVNGDYPSFYSTNCLFDRVDTACVSPLAFQNCTFFNGSLSLSGPTNSLWIESCAFDGTGISSSTSLARLATLNFNAFSTGTNVLEAAGANDVTNVNNFNFESSWFGDFYLPTNSPLINAGNTTANLVGLYHFTTQTNQTVEGDSVVDIGYHYVATDQYGDPLDSNGDGMPDYLEDANGDGIFDVGDLGDWQISPYGLGGGNALQVFTPLK